MPIKEANKNDIQAMLKRLRDAKEERMADFQMDQTIRMVNKHKQEVRNHVS